MAKRIPYAIGQSPSNEYVAVPIYAFDPIRPGQINETYPLLKDYGVIAFGTKTECQQGVRVIEQEQKRLRTRVGHDRALELLHELSSGPETRDFSKCHRCYGEGVVYVERMKLRCPLCGGSGRGMR